MPKKWWQTKRATHVSIDELGTSVCRYHDTEIVTWLSKKGYPDYVFLDLGGCEANDSNTCRRRMNEVSDHYGLGFCVFREKGETFVWALTGHKCAKRCDRLSFTNYKVSFPLPRVPIDCDDCTLTLLAEAGGV